MITPHPESNRSNICFIVPFFYAKDQNGCNLKTILCFCPILLRIKIYLNLIKPNVLHFRARDMSTPNFTVIWQVLLFVFILLIGNICWKMGIVKINGFMVGDKSLAQSLSHILASPWMWAGGVFYVLGTLWWFYIISKEELSYVYPMVSIGYILTAIAGVVLFKETVTMTRWIGMGVVSLGFIILSFK